MMARWVARAPLCAFPEAAVMNKTNPAAAAIQIPFGAISPQPYKGFWNNWLQERQMKAAPVTHVAGEYLWRVAERWGRCCTTPAGCDLLSVTTVTTRAPVSAAHPSAQEEISLCMDSPFWSCTISNGTWSIFQMSLCSEMAICIYVSLRTIITMDHDESG